MTFRELRAKLMEMNETDLDEEVHCLFDGEVFDLISVEEDDEERDSPHLVLDLPET